MREHAPRWARALVARFAASSRVDEVVGDLDEAHRLRVQRRGRILAALLTSLEAIDMARAVRRAARARPSDVVDPRRRRALPVSWLDLKLGIRMLARYPMLTLVAGFAMAFTVWVGAGTFELVMQVLRPRIPIEDGDRVVALQLRQRERWQIQAHAGLDFLIWKETLESVEDLGAFRSSLANLVIDGDVGEPVLRVAMTGSGFELARVPPALGRFLLPSDESDGAPPVVVLSHGLWLSRFGADPNVVGRVVRLGNERPTVVGVMPEDFSFPFVQDVWTPLRASTLQTERREALPLAVFARLEEGRSSEDLEAELRLHAVRMATEFPETHAALVPAVMPHAMTFLGLSVPPDAWSMVSFGLLSFNVVPIFLLLLIAANVALLMFARAAARESEIVVRTALGASRGRIVGQLFAESIVLGALAAAVGIAAAGFGLRWVFAMVSAQFQDGLRLPNWYHPTLSPTTIVYAGLLTLVGAALAGVLPGRKVTRSLGDRLKESSAGGGGLQFGGVWTAVIVAQVAITVPLPAVVYALLEERTGIEEVTIGVPVEEYLAVRVEMEPEEGADPATLADRYSTGMAELQRRLESDPLVLAVTTADRLPRMYHPWNRIEVLEGATEPPDERGHRVGRASVALDYFDALGAPILNGRGFAYADLGGDARVVIVNSSFVERVLGGRNPVGRHVRYVSNESAREPTIEGPWYEIIGVVPDLGAASGFGPQAIYHPLSLSTHSVYMTAHVRGDPLDLVPELRSLAQAVDPTLEIHSPILLRDTVSDDLALYDFWIMLLVVVSVIALVLSLAGIYAAMSFAVSRRTREIGIRVALGADRSRIVWSIFRRPLLQMGGGLLIGIALTAGLFATALGSQVVFVTTYALSMTGVTVLACIVPTRRALSVEPTDALRTE